MVTAFALISVLSSAAAFWLYLRGRRGQGVPRATVLDLLRVAPELRDGLGEASADRIAKRLLNLLDCVAVGITDGQGHLLSWYGAADEHYGDLVGVIDFAITRHRREFVSHANLSCSNRGACRMRTAFVVPLIVEGTTEGAIVVLSDTRHRRFVVMTDAVAQFVSTCFELARMESSKSALLRAEIKALRAQISPHFLHNALNTIAELSRKDAEQTEELLIELADFVRYAFRDSSMFSTLADELRNVDRYLAIETANHGGKLSCRLKVDPGVLGVVMPCLVVQPLVENAVKHGLSGDGTVTIIAEDAGAEALVSVEDNGVGMAPDRLLDDLLDAHKSGKHVGIGNINQRMKAVYGDDYALIVETAPGAGMKVILRVPKFAPGVRASRPPRVRGEIGDGE